MTTSRDVPGVALSARMYRRLLIVMPRDFQVAYADDASDVFRDLYRASFARAGIRGVITFWIASVRHLIACAFKERFGRPRRLAPLTPQYRKPNMIVAFADRLAQDVRFAVRAVVKKPAFFVMTMLIVAIGVGATTTIFSVVDGVLLKGLPIPDVDQLVFFDNPAHSPLSLVAWRDRTTAFSPVAGAETETVDLTGHGEPQRLEAARVTPSFLEVLGGQPLFGRLFTPDDYLGPPRVVLLSFASWRTRWGGDPGVVGTSITLNGEPVVVVGILPPRFLPPESLVRGTIEVWLPLDSNTPEMQRWGYHILNVVGKLSPQTTIDAARAQLDGLAKALADEVPDRFRRRDGSVVPIEIIPLEEAGIGHIAPTLYMLLGAVGLMLLIACANLANLFLARGTARSREIALRAALGAGRGRIVAQLLTESVCLALLGGGFGIGLAYLGVEAIGRFTPGEMPRADMVTVDLRILLFAVAISAGTGILFGLMPALHAARTDVNEALKEGSGGLTSRAGFKLRSVLVVTEVAMALVLLVGAGLLFNSFIHLNLVEVGFETENLTTLEIELGPTFTDEQRTQFSNQLLERAASIPGARDVAAAVSLPLVYYGNGRCCWSNNVSVPSIENSGERIHSIINPVSPNYFRVLGASLLQGREFQQGDEGLDPVPAIINETLADRLFGETNVIGQVFSIGDANVIVVGLVGAIRHWGQSQEPGNQVYVPLARFGGMFRSFRLAIRTDVDPGAMTSALRQAVWSIDPDLPVNPPVTMRQLVATSKAEPRFFTALLVAFATVAITLAAGGIYASLLYLVGQRRREVGIRMAIGARASDVLRLFLRHGLALTAIGIVLGLVGAVLASRLLATMVFGITPTDPSTFAAVALLLTAVAASASYIPARRATETDPMETLRAD